MRLDDACFGSQWLGHGRCERHDLDAEARIDGLDLIAEQPSHALDVAQRQAGPDAHGLRLAINALADQIEPPRA